MIADGEVESVIIIAAAATMIIIIIVILMVVSSRSIGALLDVALPVLQQSIEIIGSLGR